MSYDIVIPTFHRLEKLSRFTKSYFRGDITDTKLYVYFDNNDVESCEEFKKRFPDVSTIVLNKQYRAFRIWNLHLKTMASDGLFYICDDTELYPDCLKKAMQYMKLKFRDGDGVIGINQRNIMLERGGRGFCQSGMGLIGKKFVERFPERRVFCPEYVSFKADNELGQFAEKNRKFWFAKDAALIHYHPRFFKSDGEDEAHLIVRDIQVEIDRKIYAERQTKKLLWGKSFEILYPGREMALPGWNDELEKKQD
jgi:hypothetical protein